jgi:GT2 family glycosyltransferase/SAM-dependent methyltransferase/glycosyltransferase involved in cell wall biosynthesis
MVPALDRDRLIYGEHLARYFFASNLVKGRQVLDVASGSGYGSNLLGRAGAVSVVGIDSSTHAVAYSTANYETTCVKFVAGDAQSLPFRDNSFDVVVSFETIEHLTDHHQFLDEVERVLSVEGILVISTPNVEAYPQGNPFHLKEFEMDEFRGDLSKYFAHVCLLGQDNWITSAVLPEALLHVDSGSVQERLSVAKVTSRELGRSLYVVAVCSNLPLPPLVPQIAISKPSEADTIHAELVDRDVRLSQLVSQRDHALAERDELLKRVRNFQSETRYLIDKVADLREQADIAQERLRNSDSLMGEVHVALAAIIGSKSWRRLGSFEEAASRLAALLGKQTPAVPRESIEDLHHRIAASVPGPTSVQVLGVPAAYPVSFEALRFPEQADPEVSIIIAVHSQWALTRHCLTSVLKHSADVSYEVIVVDDASSDDTENLLSRGTNIRVVRNRKNLGFLASCNRGASMAKGHFLVFLNNDTEVKAGWLSALVRTVQRDDTVGIVGGKLVYPTGILQEAGGIVWADGSGMNYGRGENPLDPAYSFAREVDYCSGACLLVRRELFERLGGFDDRYAPAYYEDTDLAFGARSLGFRVMYQPMCEVVHFEGASHGTDLSQGVKRFQEINRAKFVDKWASTLAAEQLPTGHDPAEASDRRSRMRLLVVDEWVPSPDKDSGSCRMDWLLRILTRLGFGVAFLPHNLQANQPYTRDLQERGIEVLHGPINIESKLKTLGPNLRMCVLSRPMVAWRYLHLLRQFAPRAPIAYDTVDLHYVREHRRAAVESDPVVAKLGDTYRELELALVRACDATIAVTDTERATIESEVPRARVFTIPNIHQVVSFSPTFNERDGLVFVGNFGHLPNVDAVEYLVGEIMPLIHQELPDLRIHLVGSFMPQSVKDLAGPSVDAVGWIPDLEPYLGGRRVFVCPLRYGAGMKGKIGQSMAMGLPVVTTQIGIEGMRLVNGEEVLVADEAEQFAEATVRVYRDEALWNTISANGRAYITRTLSPEVVERSVRRLLDALGAWPEELVDRWGDTFGN